MDCVLVVLWLVGLGWFCGLFSLLVGFAIVFLWRSCAC